MALINSERRIKSTDEPDAAAGFVRMLSAAVLALTVGSCTADPFATDDSTATAEASAVAPVGSDARRAEAALVRRGFVCSWMTHEEIAGVPGFNDFLYCDASRRVGIVGSRRWQVAVLHSDFAVAEVQVRVGIVAP